MWRSNSSERFVLEFFSVAYTLIIQCFKSLHSALTCYLSEQQSTGREKKVERPKNQPYIVFVH